ncbi:MAG: hypothetical protein IH612_05575 [Desulfofustis sp.]|nr:hypothetical protein [Desulfofustis sp.]
MSDQSDRQQRIQSGQESGCRRVHPDRRVCGERRSDPRGDGIGRKRSIMAWVRTLTNPRIGVDRRKGIDRRRSEPERTIRIKSLLTQEELSELLK